MNRHLFKILSIILLSFAGCDPPVGIHSVVDLDQKVSTIDDTYVKYLLNQIQDDPKATDNYVKLSGIYEIQNKSEEAIRTLQKGVKATDENTKVLVELGKLYVKTENTDQLSDILKSLRNAEPDNIDFLKLSSGYALLLEDAENAVFFANRALLANPADDENYYLLASGKLLSKDSISALNTFEEAYRLRGSYDNFFKVFDLAINIGATEKAREYLLDFEDMNRAVNYCYHRGALYNATGKRDSARWVLQYCENAPIREERIDYELAKTFYPDQTDSVLFYVNKALEKQPGYLQALLLKAKTLDRQGNYNGARGVYEFAIQMDSTYTLATQGLNNLERKVAYLRLVKRKESLQRDLEILKPLNSKTIN